MSLFAERQLIEIRIPGGKPGKDGSEALQRYCETLSDDVVTLGAPAAARPPAAGQRVVRRARRRRRVGARRAGRAHARCRSGSRNAWPRRASACRTATPAPQTLAFFADRVEGNLLAAHQELQKLALLYPQGELGFEQIEAAVLNVARYDVFKLGEAVLAGQTARVLRMLDGLRAEGEAPVLVHWTLAEDIRALKRVKDAVGAGKPLPMALREARVWGAKERLFERVVPLLADHQLAHLVEAAERLRRPHQGPEASRLAARRLGRA